MTNERKAEQPPTDAEIMAGMKIVGLTRRINEWQGEDQPMTHEMLDALVWTFARDMEICKRFNDLVDEMRLETKSLRRGDNPQG